MENKISHVLDVKDFKRHPVTLTNPSFQLSAELLQDGVEAEKGNRPGEFLLKKDSGAKVTAKLMLSSTPTLTVAGEKFYFSKIIVINGFENYPITIRGDGKIIQDGSIIVANTSKSGEVRLRINDGELVTAKYSVLEYGLSPKLIINGETHYLPSPINDLEVVWLGFLFLIFAGVLFRVSNNVWTFGPGLVFFALNIFLLRPRTALGLRMLLSALFTLAIIILVTWASIGPIF